MDGKYKEGTDKYKHSRKPYIQKKSRRTSKENQGNKTYKSIKVKTKKESII
jgi:hypothetical protein